VSNPESLSEKEKADYQEYLKVAQEVGESPGMGESKDANVGSVIEPSAFLLKSARPGSYAEKLDAVFSVE
jgi:hypothetical protein